MRISDWSSDVCSSDLDQPFGEAVKPGGIEPERLDLMISGKGGDSRRRCGRRLRRGFVDSHGGGSDAKSCDCTASGKMVDRHASLLQMIITYAAPRTEQTPSTGSMPALNRNMASIAPTASASAGQLTDVRTGRSMVPAANGTSRTCSNRVWIPNQTARLRITPTTAAVIAESAADNARLPRSRSMNGAPAKIHRKHGRKVTQVVRIAPKGGGRRRP